MLLIHSFSPYEYTFIYIFGLIKGNKKDTYQVHLYLFFGLVKGHEKDTTGHTCVLISILEMESSVKSPLKMEPFLFLIIQLGFSFPSSYTSNMTQTYSYSWLIFHLLWSMLQCLLHCCTIFINLLCLSSKSLLFHSIDT
jgi:hypothetical protein